MLVIRNGHIVGEWYQDCEPTTTFNIYSSSKAYTSLAFGLILDDSAKGKLKKPITLDTKVCNEDWLPEALPLSEPTAAPAPAPIKPPETARSPGVVPQAESMASAAKLAAKVIFTFFIAIIRKKRRGRPVNAVLRQWFAFCAEGTRCSALRESALSSAHVKIRRSSVRRAAALRGFDAALV